MSIAFASELTEGGIQPEGMTLEDKDEREKSGGYLYEKRKNK